MYVKEIEGSFSPEMANGIIRKTRKREREREL